MGLLEAANKRMPQDSELDKIGRALRDRILRIPAGADVPYTALSLLKAYGSFQTGVCLGLENDVYSGYATVGLGLRKITVPLDYIFTPERAGESYFQIRDDERKVFNFIEYGMDIWCFALDDENPWGAVMLLGSDTAPSIDPKILSIILQNIQRIIHPKYKKSHAAENSPEEARYESGADIGGQYPDAEEAAADFVPEDFEAEAELEEIPEFEAAAEAEQIDEADSVIPFDSDDGEAAEVEEISDEAVELEDIDDTETVADVLDEFEKPDNEIIDEVEIIDTIDEEPVELTEPVIETVPDFDFSAESVEIIPLQPTEVSEPEPVDNELPAEILPITEPEEPVALDVPEPGSDSFAAPEIFEEPAPAEEPPVEIFPEAELVEEPPAAPESGQTDFTRPELLSFLENYCEKDGSLDGLIVELLDDPENPATDETLRGMVSHFAAIETLAPRRCLLLFPGSYDHGLIAHLLKNSIKAGILLAFSAKSPDEAYQAIRPYC